MRNWLAEVFKICYLPQMEKLQLTEEGRKQAKDLCMTMREDWAKQGKTKPTQQKPLMDEIRRAIRDKFGDESWLLDHIKLDREEYFEINQENSAIARSKQMQQQYITDPDAIVGKAVRLLESPKWDEVACALAVLTGRRLNEVMKTAEFTVKSQWVVTFRGALKRRGEEVELVFDIPTLTTAQKVVDAIAKLRQITPAGANEAAVGRASQQHFADLVPAPPSKDGLYAHLWRSVYACIATFWYCPKHCDDLLYKAHILGHFQTLSQDEMKDEGRMRGRLETFASDRHYRLYEIADEIVGQYGGRRKGVKLGHGGVEVLEAVKEAMPEAQPEVAEMPQVSAIRIWQSDKDKIYSLFERLDITEGNLQERMSQLVAWVEAQLASESIKPTPIQEPEKADSVASNPQHEVKESEEITPVAKAEQPSTPSPTEAMFLQLMGRMDQFIQLQMGLAQATNGASIQEGNQENGENGTSSQNTTPRRKRGEGLEIANQMIDQIMQYNDAEGRLHTEKWAITINALKAAGASQHSIQNAFKARDAEIQAHHERHQIDGKHNLCHRGKKGAIEKILNPTVEESPSEAVSVSS